MFNFATTTSFILAIIVSVANAILLCVIAAKLLQIFQLGGYRVRPFAFWLYDRRAPFYTRLFVFSLLGLGSMFLVSILFWRFTEIVYLSYLGLIFYAYLGIYLARDIDKKNKSAKVRLKLTPRVWRLYVVLFAMTALATYTILWLGSTVWVSEEWVRFSLIAFIPLLLPPLVFVAHCINYPLEWLIRARFTCRAQRKLRRPEFSNLVRIGITGSYGKTTCKNILTQMMAKKFNTTASPSSFNTPMGFAMTVNNELKSGCEVLIFEMGLRYKRDIKTLAKLFKPMHGILTGIGTQHIETMKTQAAIIAEKSELLRALPSNGIAVLNGESPGCVEIHGNLELENKFLTSLETNTKNISVTAEGCTFDLVFGKEKASCTTQLLGKHNIENILTCAALAHKLGVPLKSIAEAIAELKPTPHRLELIRASNGIIILDDSYNANEQGTRAALDVLALFTGKKVIQTPGIVEQGKESHKTNFKLGKRIARVADEVIIVNETNRAYIEAGLENSNFDKAKIHTVKTAADAKQLYSKLLTAGDVLLIANDLPDNFA